MVSGSNGPSLAAYSDQLAQAVRAMFLAYLHGGPGGVIALVVGLWLFTRVIGWMLRSRPGKGWW